MDTLREWQVRNIGRREEDNSDTSAIVQGRAVHFTTSVDDRQQVKIEDLYHLHSKKRIENLFNPQARHTKHYLFLDRANAVQDDPSNDTFKKLKWYLNDQIPVIQQGIVNVPFEVENIVAMRLGCINLSAKANNTVTTLQRKRLSVLVEEFSAQSIVTQEGNRAHFFTAIGNNTALTSAHDITMSPYDFNRGDYKFRIPFTKVSSITLSLFQPFQPFSLDPDTLTAQVTQGSNPATLTFSTQHGLYRQPFTISGFTTGDTVTDAAQITAMNTTFSNYTVVDPTTIQVPVDLSTTTPTADPLMVSIYARVEFNVVLELIGLKVESGDEDHICKLQY